MIDRRTLIRNGGAATAGALGMSALAPTPAAAAATDHGIQDAHHHHPADHANPMGAADPTDPTSGVTRTVLQRHPSPAKGWETVQTLVEIPRGKESG
ncbi:hypothetical protein GCM10020000_03280 [Streptomyces olivoverticillatus]